MEKTAAGLHLSVDSFLRLFAHIFTETCLKFLLIWQKHGGYPSGSMVDFACDADGSPIVAVSNWAVHAKACFAYLLSFFTCALIVKTVYVIIK